jgi:hypothetical protein
MQKPSASERQIAGSIPSQTARFGELEEKFIALESQLRDSPEKQELWC